VHLIKFQIHSLKVENNLLFTNTNAQQWSCDANYIELQNANTIKLLAATKIINILKFVIVTRIK